MAVYKASQCELFVLGLHLRLTFLDVIFGRFIHIEPNSSKVTIFLKTSTWVGMKQSRYTWHKMLMQKCVVAKVPFFVFFNLSTMTTQTHFSTHHIISTKLMPATACRSRTAQTWSKPAVGIHCHTTGYGLAQDAIFYDFVYACTIYILHSKHFALETVRCWHSLFALNFGLFVHLLSDRPFWQPILQLSQLGTVCIK